MKTFFFIFSLVLAIGFTYAAIILIRSDFQLWKGLLIMISFFGSVLYIGGAWKLRPWHHEETSLN